MPEITEKTGRDIVKLLERLCRDYEAQMTTAELQAAKGPQEAPPRIASSDKDERVKFPGKG